MEHQNKSSKNPLLIGLAVLSLIVIVDAVKGYNETMQARKSVGLQHCLKKVEHWGMVSMKPTGVGSIWRKSGHFVYQIVGDYKYNISGYRLCVFDYNSPIKADVRVLKPYEYENWK
jgi:hypothetical protein